MDGQNRAVSRGKFTGISGNTLKWIAIVTMFMDHFAYVYMRGNTYLIMRGIGRLAFPMYCFLLVEGFYHTKNYTRYLCRMAVFALAAEIPFDLALFGRVVYPGYQSVMVTMLLGLAGLGCYRWCVRRQMPIYAILVIVAFLVLGWLTKCDYGAEGVALIFVFYLLCGQPVKRAVALGIWCVLMSGLEIVGVFAVIPICLYNGQRGRGGKWFQYFGYVFYPLHLFLLWLGTVAL